MSFPIGLLIIVHSDACERTGCIYFTLGRMSSMYFHFSTSFLYCTFHEHAYKSCSHACIYVMYVAVYLSISHALVLKLARIQCSTVHLRKHACTHMHSGCMCRAVRHIARTCCASIGNVCYPIFNIIAILIIKYHIITSYSSNCIQT